MCCMTGNLCSCLTSGIGASLKEQIRTSYIALTIGVMSFLYILQSWVEPVLKWLTFAIECPEEAGGSTTCLGVSAVYRFSLALAIMHTIILFCISFRN